VSNKSDKQQQLETRSKMMLHKRDFAGNNDDLTSGHREYLDCDFLLISFTYFQRKVKR
jgi:hypothetical protein